MNTQRALLLVDLQNDFCSGGTLAVPDAEALIPLANELQQHFSLIIATKDWHPAQHESFAALHPHHKVGEVIDLHGVEQILWPLHCVQNTKGAAFHPQLETARITKVIYKGTDPRIDSYSAFYDNNHIHATGLEAYLKELGVSDIFLMGVATDYCVKFTALDAVTANFNVFLIEDGCRGVGLYSGDIENTMRLLRKNGVNIIHANDIGNLPLS